MGFPIEDTPTRVNFADSIEKILHHHLRQIGDGIVVSSGPRVVEHTYLGNHHRAVESSNQPADILLRTLIHLLPRQPRPLRHHRVVAQANHIKASAVIEHGTEEPVAVLVGVIHVHNDLHIRESFLGSLVAHSRKTGIVRPAVVDILPLVDEFAGRPKHAIGRLVADLHPFGTNTGFLQGIEHVKGMFLHSIAELLIAVVLPGCGDCLVVRVGKEIGVVEINHDAQPLFGSTDCHVDNVVAVAPPGSMMYPHAQTNGIHTHILHDRNSIAVMTGKVVKRHTIMLHLTKPTDIRPAGKGADGSGWTVITRTQRQSSKRKKNDFFHGRKHFITQ